MSRYYPRNPDAEAIRLLVLARRDSERRRSVERVGLALLALGLVAGLVVAAWGVNALAGILGGF